MSYRDDLEAMQAQVQQLEGELQGVRRERARLEQVARDEPRLVTELDRLRRTLHARAPRHLPLLDDIRVASPCHERWDDMTGDAQSRHCARCDKNVYNLSAMTREAAEALLRQKEGALCVRYFRRVDGTILTADCPVGVRRKRVQLAAAAGAMTALAAGAAVAFARMGAPMPPPPVSVQGAATVSPIVHAPPVQVLDGRGEVSEVMGDVAFEPAPAQRGAPPRARAWVGRRRDAERLGAAEGRRAEPRGVAFTPRVAAPRRQRRAEVAAPRQPLTPPAVSPPTRCFCTA